MIAAKSLPSPPRKRGPRTVVPSLALGPRFRGDDENLGVLA
jgi:hypothetical protein